MKHRTSEHARKPLFLGFIIVLFSLFVAGVVFAAPGDLDTDFNSPDGYSTLNLGTDDGANAVAVQDDGKILVGGYRADSGNNIFLLARYNTDGSLDTTFNSPYGHVSIVGSGVATLTDLAIQPDGKIVAVGVDEDGAGFNYLVARFNSDGSLDTSGFNSPTGYVTVTMGASSISPAVDIQDDGKIVICGYLPNGSNSDMAVMRFNTDGSLDTSGFGNPNGYVTATVSTDSYCSDLAIQDDGMIVVVGNANNGSLHDVFVARYETDGDLDSTFNSTGVVTTNITTQDEALSVLVQKDGKIVVGGRAIDSTTKFLLLRYNSDGSLDTSGFGSPNGYVTPDITGDADQKGVAVAQQADGKIVFAGHAIDNYYEYKLIVARFNTDGSLDTGEFGGYTGYITNNLSVYDIKSHAVAIQPIDGKIVVVGERYNSYNYDMFVSRFQVGYTQSSTIANGSSYHLAGVSITNNSGSDCDFTVTKYPVPPGGIPADEGEMPVQWNITSTCSTVNVRLSFGYSDDQLYYGNNITETSLTAFENTDGATWIEQCSTHTCGFAASDNDLSVQNVTTLGAWTLGNYGSTPTSVMMKSVAGASGKQTGMVAALVGIGGGVLMLAVRKWRKAVSYMP